MLAFKKISLLFFLLFLAINSYAENCIYLNDKGELKTAENYKLVPYAYRKFSKCEKSEKINKENNSNFKRPNEIELSGNIRKENLSNSIGSGRVNLSWQREVESLFSKNPKRAVVEAMNATARVLSNEGFPDEIKKLNIDWNIIFLGSEISNKDIPQNLISRCHPGWMRPPADIYIVASRVVEGCGGMPRLSKNIADAELVEILLHEIGHVIEYQFHNYRFKRNRFRSEGFATWFESISANYSNVIPKDRVLREHKNNARKSFELVGDNFKFEGSGYDYGRASMYFHVISNKHRVHGLMKVYKKMLDKNLGFFDGINSVYRMDRKRLNSEVREFVFGG